jgi:hypothetical protein
MGVKPGKSYANMTEATRALFPDHPEYLVCPPEIKAIAEVTMKLGDLRIGAGLSPGDVARLMKVSKRRFTGIEHGDRLTISEVAAYADALGYELDVLFVAKRKRINGYNCR